MPRRRLVGLAGILVVWLPWIGCGTGRTPEAIPPAVTASQGRRGTIRAEARNPRPRLLHAASILSRRHPRASSGSLPSEFTITADDPGVQLLVTRENSDGTTEDLTGAVRWTVTPPGLAANRAGRISPAPGPRKGGDLGGNPGTRQRRRLARDDRAQAGTTLGFRRGHRADPDPAGLQHRELPRQGRRPERLPSLALRLRSRRAITSAVVRDVEPAQGLAARSRGEPLPRQGDRPCAARRRPAARGRLRRVPDAARLDPRRGARAAREVARGRRGRDRRARPPPASTSRARGSSAWWRATPTAISATSPARPRSRSTTIPPPRSTPQGRGALLRRAEADLIVRYQSHVLSARIGTIINPDLTFDFSALPRRNFIDDELFKRLESLKVPPEPAAQRRRVPAPGLARPDRRAADSRRDPPVPGRQGPREADQADRPADGPARVRPLLADQARRPAPDQHGPPGQRAPTATRTGSTTA